MAVPKLHSRGRCPVCLRNGLLLNDDNTVARAHKNRQDAWCTGKDMEGQPESHPVPVARIRVRMSRATGRWRVERGKRLVGIFDTYDEAMDVADRLAGRQRESAEELVARLNAERFGNPA